MNLPACSVVDKSWIAAVVDVVSSIPICILGKLDNITHTKNALTVRSCLVFCKQKQRSRNRPASARALPGCNSKSKALKSMVSMPSAALLITGWKC